MTTSVAVSAKLARNSKHISFRRIVQLIIVGVLCYLIIAGFGGLQSSLAAVRATNVHLLVVATGLVILSYVMAALTYIFLSPRPLPFGPTFLIQISGGLVNRLLPGGLGGLGINGLYLHHRGYSVATAAVIITTNNFIGFVGNMLLLLTLLLTFSFPPFSVHVPHISNLLLFGICALILVGGVLAVRSIRLMNVLSSAWREMLRYVRSLIRRPYASLSALLSSCALTGLHSTALWLVIEATHVSVAWPIALLAVSVGAFTGAAVPTPGGVGGAEAGIASLLIAFGMPSAQAVAAAVLYRGLTYWLPLIPGYIALRIAEKRYL